VLARHCNLPAHTSRQYLMNRLLHALQTCRAALIVECIGRYARTRPDEDHDDWVASEYLFNCLQLIESVHRTCDSFGATLSQEVIAEVETTHGITRAIYHEARGGRHSREVTRCPVATLRRKSGATRTPRRHRTDSEVADFYLRFETYT
jgi:hypothetical protein